MTQPLCVVTQPLCVVTASVCCDTASNYVYQPPCERHSEREATPIVVALLRHGSVSLGERTVSLSAEGNIHVVTSLSCCKQDGYNSKQAYTVVRLVYGGHLWVLSMGAITGYY